MKAVADQQSCDHSVDLLHILGVGLLGVAFAPDIENGVIFYDDVLMYGGK